MGAGLRDIAPKEVYSVKVAAAAGTGDFDVVWHPAMLVIILKREPSRSVHVPIPIEPLIV